MDANIEDRVIGIIGLSQVIGKSFSKSLRIQFIEYGKLINIGKKNTVWVLKVK
ncbi:MAG TPA: hypothetical protein VD815_09380 [Candidatus Saccharimonadales bacterium]|nr:hypothetical protein [Candidatus Saccharimonadales bacterium]